jgi:hypothetical protein
MKILIQVVVVIALCSINISAQAKRNASFEDYKTSVFKGTIRSPKWIKKVSENEWRDELGKLVVPPDINFAGKYFVAAHSCGTGCRYYTMTDITNGRELDLLNGFTTAEPPPKTSDGYEYLSILYYQYDSKLMLVQYLVKLSNEKEQCRERAFLFEGGKLKPITAISYKCRKF